MVYRHHLDQTVIEAFTAQGYPLKKLETTCGHLVDSLADATSSWKRVTCPACIKRKQTNNN